MDRFGTALLAIATFAGLGSAMGACSGTANIDDVFMSLDSDGTRRRNVFYTDSKEIHCVVEAGIGRDGVTIETLVRQVQRFDLDTGRVTATDRVIAQAESAPSRSTGPQKIDLVLDKNQIALIDTAPGATTTPTGTMPKAIETPFPVGRFACEAKLDGVSKGTAVFDIVLPDCPTSSIISNTLCYGFYPQGQQCKRYGVSSTSDTLCLCEKAKGWQCEP